MKAIILAAGRSTRLYPLTLKCPKSLLKLGKTSIIEYQISALKREKVDEIVVVTGFLAKQFDFLKGIKGVKLVYNPRFADTNNLYSLWHVKEKLLEDQSICLYADLVVHPAILKKALNSSWDMGLVVDKEKDSETMQVKLEENRVLDVSKSIPPSESSGTFLGLAKFTPRGGDVFVKEMENVISKGNKDAYFTIVLQELIRKGALVEYGYTDGYPWTEVDTLEDLKRLRKEVYPKIQGHIETKEGGSC